MKQDEIANLLPEVYQRTIEPNNILDCLLAVMEGMQAPSEEVIKNLDHFFDPYRTPPQFVPFLANWVDLGMLLIDIPEGYVLDGTQPFLTGLGRLRELVAAAAEISKWRGTKRSLLKFLETATGSGDFEIEDQVVESNQIKPYHMQITAPSALNGYDVLLRQIIEIEKPAYVTYELVYK